MTKATRFTMMVSAVTMAGVKGSGKEMYAETASSATQTALAVITRTCSRWPVTAAADGCKFSLISLILFFLPDIDHVSRMNGNVKGHMEPLRFSQLFEQLRHSNNPWTTGSTPRWIGFVSPVTRAKARSSSDEKLRQGV